MSYHDGIIGRRKRVPGLAVILAMLWCAACGGGGGGTTSVTFSSADSPGDIVSVTAGSAAFNMIYSNNTASITFPVSTSYTVPDDAGTATLSQKFFMAETEVTNKLMREVLQWAYDNNKFSATVTDPDGLDSTTAKHGGQQLLNLSFGTIKIRYNAGNFTVDSGYENHPAVAVTWYGTILFCNWLSEMEDGSTDNLVYTNIDAATWTDADTLADASKIGYRLPSCGEWEFAARYIGKRAPGGANLASEYVATGVHGGDPLLTDGYYWTPGDYASGALKDYSNALETAEVAWYTPSSLMAVAGGKANQLGIHDMSGNVWEWCFLASGSAQGYTRGGSYREAADYMQVGYTQGASPDLAKHHMGFRIAKSR
jgi:formylglycine-generating enzyme required for sulfatase activity